MEKCAFIDIFTTNNDLYGKHNCPIEVSIDICDNEDVFKEEFTSSFKHSKTIYINPDEEILPIGMYKSNRKYITNNGVSFIDLKTSLFTIYQILSKIRDSGFYVAGYNHINYDLKILNEHFKRILDKEPIELPKDKVIDLMDCSENLIPVEKIGSYSMDSVYLYLYDDNDTLDNIHKERSTISDIKLSKYIMKKLMIEGESFVDFVERGKGPEEIKIFNFGKYKGATLREIFLNDQKYLNWILNNKDFQEKRKNLIESIKKLYNEPANLNNE